MKRLAIAICSDVGSWINPYISELVFDWLEERHEVTWTHNAAELPGGDVCIYLSYGRIAGQEIRSRYVSNVVVHESDLPKGRGWSPLTWQILAGADRVCVSLFEAADDVDSGPIYLQETIEFKGDELVDELRFQQATATLRLCKSFVAGYPQSLDAGRNQVGEPTYFPRRRPLDSKLDPELSLRGQFQLLRVVDNDRYPAWFEVGDMKYVLKIEKQRS